MALAIPALLVVRFWQQHDASSKEVAVVEQEGVMPEDAVPGKTSEGDSPAAEPVPTNGADDAPEEKLPDKILIDVPFTSQAPLAKWDQYHEEACEEASLVMVEYYLKNKPLTPAIAEKEIQALIAYEIEKNGDYRDTTAAQTAKLGADYYGIKNLRVVYDFSKDDLERYLSLGRPIIVPAAGRLLGNPNFTPPGPLYHNLVLVGYDGDTIITNDPGTRKGQLYRYDLDTLYKAIHDFPGDADKIVSGRKAMIILSEPHD